MLYLAIKAALSGILIARFSQVAKRYPGFGGLIASLPLVSVLGMIWLWRDKPDLANMAAHAEATFQFVLPSLPMFLLIPVMLRNGFGFWVSLVAECVVTVLLYSIMVWAGPRLDCASSAGFRFPNRKFPIAHKEQIGNNATRTEL